MAEVSAKWRPSMAIVVGLVCLVLVSVPVLALMSMRLTSNQFVRETEQTLINQAAIYAQVYGGLLARQGGVPEGPPLSDAAQAVWSPDLHPWTPVLNLRRTKILPPLPEEDASASTPPAPAYEALAEEMLALARAARKTTLAGAFFLDHRGVDIRPGLHADYSAAPEVQAALAGRVGTALRDRGDTYERHPLTSISRDTWYRVFVAYPVIQETRVVGVVYLSRTPSSLGKFIMVERAALLMMLGTTLMAAAIVGWLLLRLFSRPVRALSAQATKIATGQLSEPAPLNHYGVREVAVLGQSVIRMAKTLTDRSRQVTTYTDHVTHELKSPVTAILGAAELLGSDITPEAREKLQQNIEAQAIRMNALLEKLREMARLRDAPTTGRGPIHEMLPDLPGLRIEIGDGSEPILPILPEHGRILFQQLARNAAENGATQMRIHYREGRLSVQDNGRGIPPEHIAKVTDPFFTTRRDEGGTGLGLAIIAAVLQNYGGSLTVEPSDEGARILITYR